MFNKLLKKTIKIVKMSTSSILILSIIPLVYSLIKEGNLLKNVFDFNYLIASIIILYGLMSFFVPVSLKKSNRLVDHSNYAEVLREEKEKKIDGSLESIFWGITNIILLGLFEIFIRSIV